jgi:hypothetical protein
VLLDVPFKRGRVDEHIALEKQLRKEWGNENIHVIRVSPDGREMSEDEYFRLRTPGNPDLTGERLGRKRKDPVLAKSVDEIHPRRGDGHGDGDNEAV